MSKRGSFGTPRHTKLARHAAVDERLGAEERHGLQQCWQTAPEPYTAEEIAKIIAATDAFGKGQYERLRALAMILLMRYYGLRVSDVATLRRDRIRGNQIFLHALKNDAAIWLPLYAEVDFALCAVPKPYGAEENGPYVFWSGRGDVEEHTKTRGRTLQAVFLKSGVSGATSHRFRHTLATECW